MIFIIDNYDSFTYNLYQLIASQAPTVKVVRNDKITVTEVKALNPKGIVLSPGPGRPEKAGICIELIQALGHQIPILGVCLGHQAIATAFGGKVIGANQIVHGKKTMVFHHQRDLYQKMPLPFAAARYHSLMVEMATLPACLEVEAENAEGMVMGMRHREFPIYGVQFHPESILTPQGQQLLNNFINRCG